MEEVAMAANALYESLSAAEKVKIQTLFKSIDKDGDGRISISEFTSYMEGAGSSDYMRSLFKLLDQSGDGFLQCDELFTLAYIQASGRPGCDACGVLILGLYFTCTDCRLTNHSEGHTFNLCVPCYRAKRFQHHHSEFDDNYTLLLKMQSLLLSLPQARPGAFGHSSSSKKKKGLLRAFKALVRMVPDVISFFT
ncbi:hypothetical protein K1719_039246 [Acacia pycnantha]|nr:hypothetical protein K1719_039246 [Acacia pycnantha]